MSLCATPAQTESQLQFWSQHFQDLLEKTLNALPSPSPLLKEALIYSAINGGKNLRPLLVYACGAIFNTPLALLDPAALAIEMIHAYSLVHDDLPAMDNASTRRGKPSCFKAHGEDIAILAGDALQTLAFEILSDYPALLSAEQRLKMVQILSRASGLQGMAGGQALDIRNQGRALSEAELCQLYRLKTGALLEAAIQLGLQASRPKDPAQVQALKLFASHLSLAFQIQDDLLDAEGCSQTLGKPAGLDLNLDKYTYPRVLGLERAKEKAAGLFEEAYRALAPLGEEAATLRTLCEKIEKRKK